MTEKDFEHTAQRIRPRLIELGRSFFGSEAQAEDAAQEALVRLWVLRDRVNDSTYAESLLVRMMKNICVSMWREHHQQTNLQTDSILKSEILPMENDENTRKIGRAHV